MKPEYKETGSARGYGRVAGLLELWLTAAGVKRP